MHQCCGFKVLENFNSNSSHTKKKLLLDQNAHKQSHCCKCHNNTIQYWQSLFILTPPKFRLLFYTIKFRAHITIISKAYTGSPYMKCPCVMTHDVYWQEDSWSPFLWCIMLMNMWHGEREQESECLVIARQWADFTGVRHWFANICSKGGEFYSDMWWSSMVVANRSLQS